MDINLTRMSGLQALKEAPARHARNPQYSSDCGGLQPHAQDIEAGLRAGFDAYLIKPIQISELMNTIEKLPQNSVAMI